jgi:hypothetical protein
MLPPEELLLLGLKGVEDEKDESCSARGERGLPKAAPEIHGSGGAQRHGDTSKLR